MQQRPRRSELRITKRTVDALTVDEKDSVFWDRDLAGLGVRVHATGRKTYVVQSRGPTGPKRVTLGLHGDLSADEARKQAAVVIDRIKRGEAPVPAEPETELTVAALAERFMRVHVEVHCKPRTIDTYRGVLELHIVPALGGMALSAVGRREIAALHHRLRDTPCTANATVRIVSSMFKRAEAWELVPPGRISCRRVRRYKQQSRERFLTLDEYRQLGRVLREAEADGSVPPAVVAAFRLLILTGCRHSEILSLRWDGVDRTANELRLRDAKTGPRMVPLTEAVAVVLDGIKREPGNLWVIVGERTGTRLSSLRHHWHTIRAKARLDDVRLHDCRHSYASRALVLGESLPAIGKLLGHRKVSTTARYAHLARDSIHESAARIADSLAADILGDDRRLQTT